MALYTMALECVHTRVEDKKKVVDECLPGVPEEEEKRIT